MSQSRPPYEPTNDPVLVGFKQHWNHQIADSSLEAKAFRNPDLGRDSQENENLRKHLQDAASKGDPDALALLGFVHLSGVWPGISGYAFNEPEGKNRAKGLAYLSMLEQSQDYVFEPRNYFTNLFSRHFNNGQNPYLEFKLALTLAEQDPGIDKLFGPHGKKYLQDRFNIIASNNAVFDEWCQKEDLGKVFSLLTPTIKELVEKRQAENPVTLKALSDAAIKEGLKHQILNEAGDREQRQGLSGKASSLISSFLQPESKEQEMRVEAKRKAIQDPLQNEKILFYREAQNTHFRTEDQKRTAFLSDFLKEDSIYTVMDLLSETYKASDARITWAKAALAEKRELNAKEKILMAVACIYNPELGNAADYAEDSSIDANSAKALQLMIKLNRANPAEQKEVLAEVLQDCKEMTLAAPLNPLPWHYLALFTPKADREKAKEYLQKAAALGDFRAAFLAVARFKAEPEDLALLMRAAKKDYAETLKELVEIYITGDIVPKDEAFAAACCRLAKWPEKNDLFSMEGPPTNPAVIYHNALAVLEAKDYNLDAVEKYRASFNELAEKKPAVFCALMALYQDPLENFRAYLEEPVYQQLEKRQQDYLNYLEERRQGLKTISREGNWFARDVDTIINSYLGKTTVPLPMFAQRPGADEVKKESGNINKPSSDTFGP